MHHQIQDTLADKLLNYVSYFNLSDEELYRQHIPNEKAHAFLQENIPLFECPDSQFEMTWYFRWWTYRKHIRQTADGFVVTEFLPQVSWSGKHNTINMASPMHIMEGRWLHNPLYLDDYTTFWYRRGGSLRVYTSWLADAIWQRAMVTGDMRLPVSLLDDLVADYEAWEKGFDWYGHRLGGRPNGLFYTTDGNDGGEISIGGHGFRPLINSAMYGFARAISRIAALDGQDDLRQLYHLKAEKIKALVMEKLWDQQKHFFMVLNENETSLSDARELYGYAPWYFDMMDPGYAACWGEICQGEGFSAPYGLTFTEQRHPGFQLSYEGHECQWNGPSWPLATSITLTALANLLNSDDPSPVGRRAYFDSLLTYARSQRIIRPDGRIVPWIDENLHPYTGDWIARTRLEKWEGGTWSPEKGGPERGKDYNHSTFCDLVITGLVGIRPATGDLLMINPLLPEKAWDWFCLHKVRYHGRELTVIWDRTGEKYHLGKGLMVLADGVQVAASDHLASLWIELK
jgi:hypothetical protein